MGGRGRGPALSCVAGYAAGVSAWLGVVAAGVAVFQGPSFWWDTARVAGEVARTVLYRSEYGYEFALVTTHLWGSAGAVLAFSTSGRRGRSPLSGTAGWLFGLACLALLLGSLRWLAGELLAMYPGNRIGPSAFVRGLDRRALMALPLAFLGAVAWARWGSAAWGRAGGRGRRR